MAQGSYFEEWTDRNRATHEVCPIALRTLGEPEQGTYIHVPENDSGRNHTLTSHHILHWNGITLFEDRSQEKGVRDAFAMHSRLVTETDAESGPERQFTTPT